MGRKLDNQTATKMVQKRWGVTFTGRLKDGKLTYMIRGRKYQEEGSLEQAFATMATRVRLLDEENR